MQNRTRWHPAARITAAAVAAVIGWFLVGWLVAPVPICRVLGEADSSYTCPNRFGFSLPSPAILAIEALGAAAVGFVGWNATSGRPEDG